MISSKLFGLSAVAFFFLLGKSSFATEWPDNGWLGDKPRADAILSAVAFVSPVDLEFFQITGAWKRLDKKYHELGVDFLTVVRSESSLPFSRELVVNEEQELGFTLPTYLDETAEYSKLWKAYVTPSVNLVLKNRKLIGFESGLFDPGLFEKTLQKALKENGVTVLPPKEFPSEGDTKICGHSRTTFLSEKFQRAWGASSLGLEGVWTPRNFWMEKRTSDLFSLETSVTRSNLGIVAEASNANPAKISVTMNGQALPLDLRGRDVQEDKTGKTFITIKETKLYEVLSHSNNLGPAEVKIKLTTTAKGLVIWSIQTLPFCQIFS